MAEKVITRDVTHDIQTSYLDYSMDVIVGRAIADVRDGCKPVHRRILHAMNETGNTCSSPYKKSARTVGEVLGKYHPHGDSSVYDAMVRLAQDFSLRYPLIDGHGNFGSIDGDSAAAMRYTEARMSKLANTMMEDIDKDTVNMMKNYDETLNEPTVLPAKLPNLLVNGSEGVAVGFASNIPPHNITESLEGIIAKIDDPTLDSLGLMKYIKGPDFPSGSTILGKSGIVDMYTTGIGKIPMRANYIIEDVNKGKTQQIVFVDVPYQVVKSKEIAKIEELCTTHMEVKGGKNVSVKPVIDGVAEVRDETDRNGIRIVLELKKNANAARIIRKIYKSTSLQCNFNAQMIALKPTGKGQQVVPHLFTLAEIVDGYIQHRKNVVRRKYEFLEKKAEARKHILDGLVIAVNAIDEVVATIRKSKDKEDARINLCDKFGLDTPQALAVLAYRLQSLSGLEIDKLHQEMTSIEEAIAKFKKILSSEANILGEVKNDCYDMLKTYGDERHTKLGSEDTDEDEDEEATIEDKEMVVTISNTGYVKSVPLNEFSAQNRGGKGIKGVKAENSDAVKQMLTTNKKNLLLCIGSDGRAYRLSVAALEESSRMARGQYINNLLEADGDVEIVSVIGVERSKIELGHVLFFTERGEVKRIALKDLITSRKCVKAVTIKEDDSLVNAAYTEEDSGFAFVATLEGKLLKFNFDKLRDKGRSASTQKCIKLADGDYVVSADIVSEGGSILTVSTTGIGKKSNAGDYRTAGLGGQGVMNYRTTKDTKVASVISVVDDNDILVACDNGKLIRVHASDFRDIGRSSRGNKLVNLAPHESVLCANAVVRQDDEENTEPES